MNLILTSFYDSIKSNSNIDRNMLDVFSEIQNGKYQTEIIKLRKNLGHSKELKQNLNCFMISGTFAGSKKQENLNSYSQIIHLDYDYLPIDQLLTLKTKVSEISTTFACFISPSGKGLKVFIRINSTSYEHQMMYQEIRSFYDDVIGFESDNSCSNINRACFVSWDPELFLNINSECFIQTEIPKSVHLKSIQMSNNKTFQECINFTNQICEYSVGNRNNYIYNLARNANRWGLEISNVITESIQIFDLRENEIRATINSAYKNEFEFGKFAKSANFADFANFSNEKEKSSSSKKNVKIDSPFIPDKVYENLPKILKTTSEKFTNKRQKDTFLTSAIGVLSGCLPNVEGPYGKKIIFPNTYTMILAAASSGKSVMNFAIDLCRYSHLLLRDNFKNEMKNYEVEIKNYNSAVDKSKIPIPDKPTRKTLIIPGNSSSTSMYNLLNNNQGSGIMVETEADTVGNVLKSEWGSFSELLRKAFEHERLTLSRITNDVLIEIEKPRMSVVLSGTPNQIFNIMTSAEDGLVSRFIYYYFEEEKKWISQRPVENEISLIDFFEAQSKTVHSMIEFFEQNPTKFKFNTTQWDEHDSIFDKYYTQILNVYGNETQSIINRIGQIFFRVAMTLTAIRKFEGCLIQELIDCHPDDFETARLLMETYIQHSLIVFKNLPSSSKNNFQKPLSNFEKVFDKLNPTFKRKEAVEIGETLDLSQRTIDEKLKEYVGKNLLSKPKAGTYEKIKSD